MKNKILTLLLIGSMLFSANGVLAMEESSGESLKPVLAAYNSEGRLIGIKTGISVISETDEQKNVSYAVSDADMIDNAAAYSLLLIDTAANTFTLTKDISFVSVPTAEPSAEPTVEPSTAPTAEPTAKPTATPAATYPSVYPTQRDAVNAMALVTNVSRTVDENNDTITKIECYYQGSERVLLIEDGITLDNGNDLTTLKAGDMIHFITGLNGKIKSVSLDFRPTSKDTIKTSEDLATFQSMLSNVQGKKYADTLGNDKTGYLFGIIGDRGNNTITLYNTDGLYNSSVDLSYSRDTIVYTCNLYGKADISKATTSAIQKSSFSKSLIDDNDNITWSDDSTYVYALANVIDDEIVEVIIYTYDK